MSKAWQHVRRSGHVAQPVDAFLDLEDAFFAELAAEGTRDGALEWHVLTWQVELATSHSSLDGL